MGAGSWGEHGLNWAWSVDLGITHSATSDPEKWRLKLPLWNRGFWVRMTLRVATFGGHMQFIAVRHTPHLHALSVNV